MEERFSPLLAREESGGVVAKVGMGESDDKERTDFVPAPVRLASIFGTDGTGRP